MPISTSAFFLLEDLAALLPVRGRARFPFDCLPAAILFSWDYRFRSTGETSILPPRSCSVAAEISGSWPKTTIQFSLMMRETHCFLVSKVCNGYKSYAMIQGYGIW